MSKKLDISEDKFAEIFSKYAERWVDLSRIKRSLAERIAVLTEIAGGREAAAKAMEVGVTTLDNYRAGKTQPKFLELIRLIEAAGKDAEYVLSPLGYRDLLPVQKGGLIEAGFVSVPRLDVRASAGNGRVAVIEDAEAQIVAFREDWLRRLGVNPAYAVIIIADGDSMAGTIDHGDLVLVDRSIDGVVDDGVYCLVYDGLVKLKRLQRLRTGILLLKSDNPAYETEEVQAHELPELIIEGRVRWAGGAI